MAENCVEAGSRFFWGGQEVGNLYKALTIMMDMKVKPCDKISEAKRMVMSNDRVEGSVTVTMRSRIYGLCV